MKGKFVSLVLASVATAVPFGSLPIGIIAPNGYTDYTEDPTYKSTGCAPSWQYCGHVNWQIQGAWEFSKCCAGSVCDPTTYTCNPDLSSGSGSGNGGNNGSSGNGGNNGSSGNGSNANSNTNGNSSGSTSNCAMNSPPSGVVGPSGYCSYVPDYVSSNVPQWQSCGREGSSSAEWVYATCASGLQCQDQKTTPPSWGCMMAAATWAPEDVSLLCSCCKNSCGFKMTYDCLEVDSTTCSAYGSDYHYCDASYYNTAKCAEVKESDELNWYRGSLQEGPVEWPKRVFAPYLDGGLYPIFEASKVQREQGINHFILAFIVARQDQDGVKCVPNYGAVVDARTGPTSYNSSTGSYDYFYDEISRVREAGGDVAISFGGALNTELADAEDCVKNGDISALVNAYKIVVDATRAKHIDFDIEGAAIASLNKQTGWTYRFDAVNQLMQLYPTLKVSFTLPVLSTGLTQDGQEFVKMMMERNVPWDMFNIMAMDYGDAGCDLSQTNAMGKCEISAIKSTAAQLYAAAQQTGKLATYGWNSVQDVYPKMGSTPMIGLNDIVNEIYTLEDVAMVWNELRTNLPIRMWSSWSIWRDQPCALNYVDTKCTSQGPQNVPGKTPVQAQTLPYQFSHIQKSIATLA